jgi:drug/metabolite transporter (DMT)-like permease
MESLAAAVMMILASTILFPVLAVILGGSRHLWLRVLSLTFAVAGAGLALMLILSVNGTGAMLIGSGCLGVATIAAFRALRPRPKAITTDQD